ncbi:MAG: 2,3-bisphosphoglycerate-independent phosphoglycerate mutase [Candidatus Bathyarchaeota archaeon]|nr:2,3-bisphosphoglycerate-independent phosphoglycerate mutase [Candidatus Bathyarchaeota archaeon]
MVGDGMADTALLQLKDRTPLEAANTPNLDRLASNGASGLLDSVSPGFAPGSDAANLAILGYDIPIFGRGPFEAAGAGLPVVPGDLAFRCNFATVDVQMGLVDERAGRIGAEAETLGKLLEYVSLKENPDSQIIFKQTLGFKGALVIRGNNVSRCVNAEIPIKGEKTLVKPLNSTPEAKATADALNEFIQISHQTLQNHPINQARIAKGQLPANIVIPWSGGLVPELEPFSQKYPLKAACVAAVSIIKGIGKLTGMRVLDVEGATGDVDTDTLAKADAALLALKDYDFVFVHVEGTDEASHDGNLQGKIEVIQKIDSMVGRILDGVDLGEVCVALMADHATSTETRKHLGISVPITVASKHISHDGVKHYNEKAVFNGGLGHMLGKNVMPLILDLMRRKQQ